MESEIVIEKLRNRDAVIGIIGLGYVGLPLMIRYVETGFKVIGFDVDPSKVDKLNLGESYIEHIFNSTIIDSNKKGMEATADFGRLSDVDVIIICVPTPLNKYREPEMRYILETTQSIKSNLKIGHLISLESTTYPGTTEELVLPILEETGLKGGVDFWLVYSPEREDPGNKKYETRSIPKVVGGYTDACLEVGVSLYTCAVDQVVPVSSTQTAELTKLLENIYRSVNIGLVNEMKILADHMGINIHEVINAAATKPFGFTPFYPGPGLGGHCIPIDPFYLTWKAREFGVNTRFIELAGEVNTSMPRWVIGKVASALNTQKKALNGAKILVLGIAYKKNVDDMRESPSVEMMNLLEELGAEVEYSDPHVPLFPKMRRYSFELESIAISPDVVRGYDLLLIATDHDQFDYEMIQDNAKLIVDSRGVYEADYKNVVRA